ncbi:hypothetical protein L2E82_49562 [Cichorium intybus]|uniref:Uncharacterized protein n=1 Tax=Cichorium intybus TaxID=13427 RepID=A0ACB8Z0U9_CICIN|nr:hypothetical protein L2E82_49562 [Cichorium intybus]
MSLCHCLLDMESNQVGITCVTNALYQLIAISWSTPGDITLMPLLLHFIFISGMEVFRKAKVIRLQSWQKKYLVADDDKVTVQQSNRGSSLEARWIIEYVENNPNVIRLKSCHGLYLSATDKPFLLGITGKKVEQYPSNMIPDHSTEWEPIQEGTLFHVKLQTSSGKFLRANGGLPPWRGSITHDVISRSTTQDSVLWEVEIISMSDTESGMSSLSSFPLV